MKSYRLPFRAAAMVMGREVLSIWPRIVLAILVLIIFRRSEIGVLPFLLISLILGSNIGTRDRMTGFDLQLMALPISRSAFFIIQFLVRSMVVALFIIGVLWMVTDGLFSGFRVSQYTFSLMIPFLAATAASLASRKEIIAICLASGLVLGWYLLLIGIAWIGPTRDVLMFAVIFPSAVPIFEAAVIIIMTGITLLLVSGLMTRRFHTRYPVTLRQVVGTWLAGSIVCAASLLLVPLYFESKPLESCSSAAIVGALPSGDEVLVQCEIDNVPMGVWLVGSQGSKRVTSQTNYFKHFKSSCGQFWGMTAFSIHRTHFDIYELQLPEEEPRSILKRSIEGRISSGFLRQTHLPLSPDNAWVALSVWESGPVSVQAVHLDDPLKDWTWRPDPADGKQHVFALGWADAETMIVL
ncbi:hypothetical protein JXA80_06490, partial [bacterium]|nr:hypothetical protein [candidate division CSSED10-310 bacterium]